ncbi:MAG: hypothetical protein ACI8Q1_001650 [Parvicella sp.]
MGRNKKPIRPEHYNKLLNSTVWGGGGLDFFKEELEDVILTNEQKERLITDLGSGVSSGLEFNIARATIEFLKPLKTKH